MTEETPISTPPLSLVEQAVVARLSESDIEAIDATLLAKSIHRWRKVARVVAETMDALKDRYPEVSYIFYAQRLTRLAEAGRLESQGKLSYMRFSEVRLPVLPSMAGEP